MLTCIFLSAIGCWILVTNSLLLFPRQVHPPPIALCFRIRITVNSFVDTQRSSIDMALLPTTTTVTTESKDPINADSKTVHVFSQPHLLSLMPLT